MDNEIRLQRAKSPIAKTERRRCDPPGCRAVCFLLWTIGLFIYANAIFHPFVHDDIVFIETNPAVRTWNNLADIFLKASNVSSPQTLANPYYRPVLDIIYKMEYQLFGLNPHLYHLFNIFLHITNSFLIYILMCLILSRQTWALIIAILFLIHPAQSESVACIAGISNLVFVFFGLLCFINYIWAAQKPNPPAIYYRLSLIFFVLALFSKEQAVILPLLISIYEWMSRRSISFQTIGLWMVLAGYFMFRNLVAGIPGNSVFQYGAELELRILQIPQTIWIYFKVLLFPHDLHYYRSLDILSPWRNAAIILSALFLGLILLMRRLSESDRRYFMFGMAWFVITLLPVLNIVPLINEYSFILTAEHFLYLPLAGFAICFLVVMKFINERFLKFDPRISRIILLAVGVVLGSCTLLQNTCWRGEIPLFKRMLQFEPNFGRGHLLLARAYYLNGRLDEAILEYTIGLHIMQNYLDKINNPKARDFYLGFIKNIHFELAHVYESKKDFPKELEEYQRAIQIDPQNNELFNNIGNAYLHLGRFEEAERSFERSVFLNPDNLMAQNNLAIIYLTQGDKTKAREILEGILKKSPDFQAARQNLQKLNKELGQ